MRPTGSWAEGTHACTRPRSVSDSFDTVRRLTNLLLGDDLRIYPDWIAYRIQDRRVRVHIIVQLA